MGKSQRKKLEKEIRTKIFEAKVREGSFKEESQYREKEALDKVSKKALQAIAKIAKAESYDLIVHNEAVLYAVEAIDLTEQVAKELK
jgi:Skp family chaperone for outer membrane proteins